MPSSPRSSSSSKLRQWLLLAFVVIVLDQITKWLIVRDYAYGDAQVITSYFNLVRAHNTGAAFSFLAQAGGWQRWFFVGLGLAATGVITWLLRSHGNQTLFSFALAMILGGALGNVIDRLIYGYVIDFLQFHWNFLSPLFPGGYFPAFNVADCGITIGATGLILDELRRVRHSR